LEEVERGTLQFYKERKRFMASAALSGGVLALGDTQHDACGQPTGVRKANGVGCRYLEPTRAAIGAVDAQPGLATTWQDPHS